MNLDQKLRALKKTSQPRDPERELAQTLEYLRRMEKPPEPRKLPAQRVDKGIEEYVEGVLEKIIWASILLPGRRFHLAGRTASCASATSPPPIFRR